MARIRTIRPELLDSEKLGSLSILARLTFIGLISLADDDGRGRGDPKFLLCRIHPYAKDVGLAELNKALIELEKTTLVCLYKVSDSHYYQLPGWREHQKIDRPRKSLLPPNPTNSTNIRRSLDEHSSEDWKGLDWNGMEWNTDSGSSLKKGNGAQVHKSVDNSALLETRMPWGKQYKDVYIANLPFDYCEWCLSSANKKRGTIGPELQKALQARIDQKLGEMTGAQRKAHGRA